MEKARERHPKIHFYNAEHSYENFDEIWEASKDADCIFMELIADRDFKDTLQDLINFGASTPDRLKKMFISLQLEAAVDSKLLVSMGRKVIETGKEIFFIDVNEGEEVQKKAAEAFDHLRASFKLKNLGEYDMSLVCYTSFAKLLAESSIERENVTAEEIQDMIRGDEGDFQDKKIVVIQGAIHTRVYHEIKRRNPLTEVTRSFKKPDFFFSATHHLVRRIMFGKPVSAEDYKRAYLSTLFFNGALIKLYGGRLSDQGISRKSSEIAGKIPSKELDLYWEQLKQGNIDAEKIIRKYY